MLALVAATSLSCSDLPTKPLSLVTVTGAIQDRDGAPLESFGLYFRSHELNVPGGSGRPDPHLYGATRTGPDGVYSIQLYAGTYDVEVVAPTYSGYEWSVDLSATFSPGHARLDYRYSGVRVRGWIYGPGGNHLPGSLAQALLLGPQEQLVGFQEAVDTGQGFSMLIPPGRCDFSIGDPYGDGVPSIDFPGYAISTDTTLYFHLDGFPVNGTVTGPGGVPLEGVSVVGYSDDASCESVSRSDGSYQLHLPAGVYRWSVDLPAELEYIAARGFAPANIAGPAQFDFSLAGVTWTGRVRVLPDSTPARGYGVIAGDETIYSSYGARTQTDTTGSFRLVLAPGTLYQVRVDEPQTGGLYWILGRFIAGGDSTLDVVLDPAAGRPKSRFDARALTHPPAAIRPAPGRTPRPAPLPRP